MKDRKILIGSKAICDYLDISRPTFQKFVAMGLPATIIDNRWYAHCENIDRFFQKLTFQRIKEIPEDVE